MFLTSPDDRMGVTPEVRGIQLQGWRTVLLSFPMRCFLPTWISTVDRSQFPARAFLMFEDDLRSLLKEIGPSALQRLQYLMPQAGDAYRLQLREVTKLWTAHGATEDSAPQFLMEDESGVRFMHHGSEASVMPADQVWTRKIAGRPGTH